MEEVDIDNLTVYVVWSSQTGAKEKHVAGGAELMQDERALHYWDPDMGVGEAFQDHIANLGAPAWDVWMLFAPGVVWDEQLPPAPSWWEHQLGILMDEYGDLRLDSDRFAQKALQLSTGEN